ncbi:MAG: DUF389 domain-containing protein, partial [Waterburya sp.]
AQIGSAVITNFDVSAGSFLLFIVNLAGITFTACLVFLSQSYGNLYKAFQTILIWLLIIAVLCGPLTGSMREFVVANRIALEIRGIREEKSEISQLTQIRHIDVRLEGSTAYVSILGSAPQGVVTDEYLKSSEKRIFDTISKMGVESMNMKIRIYPVEIREYQNIID